MTWGIYDWIQFILLNLKFGIYAIPLNNFLGRITFENCQVTTGSTKDRRDNAQTPEKRMKCRQSTQNLINDPKQKCVRLTCTIFAKKRNDHLAAMFPNRLLRS